MLAPYGTTQYDQDSDFKLTLEFDSCEEDHASFKH